MRAIRLRARRQTVETNTKGREKRKTWKLFVPASNSQRSRYGIKRSTLFALDSHFRYVPKKKATAVVVVVAIESIKKKTNDLHF